MVLIIYIVAIIILGIGSLVTFTRIKSLRPYALFLSFFVTLCMGLSLLYVQYTTLLSFSIVPSRPAELRGFPLDIVTRYTLNGETTTIFSGWKSSHLIFDEVFYFLVAFVLLGGYALIKKVFSKNVH